MSDGTTTSAQLARIVDRYCGRYGLTKASDRERVAHRVAFMFESGLSFDQIESEMRAANVGHHDGHNDNAR